MEDIILAIAAGLSSPKKDFEIISKRNQYLNYSLLGLATILSKKHQIVMYQGDFWEPEEFIKLISKNINLSCLKYPVLMSIPSYYAIPWCKKICRILKKEYGVKIIAGGKWVIGNDIRWLKRKIPEIDTVIMGDGDNVIESVVHGMSGMKVNKVSNIFRKLDYSLLYNYKKYQPSIEVSRGCGRGCNFCAEADIPKSKIISPVQFYEQVKSIENVYNSQDFNLYLQSSTFSFENELVDSLNSIFEKLGYVVNWRCTSRVDTVPINKIEQLSRVGLRVLDIGLESASQSQLIRMGKTNNPERYLEQAEKILHECSKYNIYVKVNILLYSGESFKTINETIQWIEKNKKFIKGVSANPQIIYGYDNNIMDKLRKNGSSYTGQFSLEKDGYSYINLSEEVSYDLAQKACLEISRIAMNDLDYYELKKYGYFARDYKIDDYKKDIEKIDQSILPFTKTINL